MKIALTGSSSTGKTTLARALMKDKFFAPRVEKFITTDARRILHKMGHTSMDPMTQNETRFFQAKYFARKIELEANIANFITDRSFVDVAAYWTIRDAAPDEEIASFIGKCREKSLAYDVHFYLPAGVIPFEGDGYRSEDLSFHENTDLTIKGLLDEWGTIYVPLNMADLNQRVKQVVSWVMKNS